MPEQPFRDFVAVVKGAGELASGVAFRLHRAGFQVVMTELEQPSCISHTACFASAIHQGSKELDGVTAVRAGSVAEALAAARAGQVGVVPDPQATLLQRLRPTVLVDGIMAKRNLGTSPADAPIVIGLGPGFAAPENVHAVVETKRGHRLGWVITEGSAESNTGVPELIEGQSISRMLTAPSSGAIELRRSIGDRVRAGDPVATVASKPVVAGISGLLRGLLPAGYLVETGDAVGEIDPAAEPDYCWSLSDRALAVGSGALAAILELWPSLPAGEELPPRTRGRRPRARPGEDILGAAEYALLGLLADRPAHGYELSRAFGEDGELSTVCRLGLSQLYADLNKLEALGLVADAPDAIRPGKRVYSVTQAGQRQLETWLAQPVPHAGALRIDFMAKLYFARRRGSASTLISAQMSVLEKECDELRRQQAGGGFRAEVARAYEQFAAGSLDWLRSLEPSAC